MKKLIKIIVVGLIGVVVLILWKCPFETITGIPCPGCMMTTAFYYLIQFDFEKAFYFNPVIYLLVLMFIPLVYSYYKNKKLFNKILGFTLVLWGMIYIYRMITIFPNYPMAYVENNLIQKVSEIYESIINKW